MKINKLHIKNVVCCLIVYCFLGTSTAFGAIDVSVKSGIDKVRALLGEPIKYTLTLSRKKNISVDMPTLGAHLGNFDIRDYNISEPEEKDGMVMEKHVYVIASFQLGKSEIPSFTIKYKTSDGKEKKIFTEKTVIEIVTTPKKEMKDIIGLKTPMEKKFEWSSIKKPLFTVVFLLIIGVLGMFIYRLLSKKKTKKEDFLETELSPDEWAFSVIQKLEDSDILTDDRVKDYYDFLSDVVRRFFEKLHNVELMELTTSEFNEKLKNLLSDNAKESLVSFLHDCDMVKFADQHPEECEIKEISDRAREIVRFAMPIVPTVVEVLDTKMLEETCSTPNIVKK